MTKKLNRQKFILREYLTKDNTIPHLASTLKGEEYLKDSLQAPPLPSRERAGVRDGLPRQAIVQPHCHHQSIFGFEPEKRLLEQMGMEVTVPEPGCCGMAGSFGFEENHYAVSQQIAERALLPAVRMAPPEMLVIADGFS